MKVLAGGRDGDGMAPAGRALAQEVRERAKARRVASQRPDDFRPDFDLAAEVGLNPRLYLPGADHKSVTVTALPGYLRIALDVCRAQCESRERPSLNSFIVCCVARSVAYFYVDADIKALVEARDALTRESATATDPEAAEFVAQFLGRFPLSIPGTMTKPQRVTVVLPQPVFNELANRCEVLCIDKTDMVVLCVLLAIAYQHGVCAQGHVTLAASTFEKFRARVRLMRRLTELCREEFIRHA